MMNDFNYQRKNNERNGIAYHTKPYCERVEEEDLIDLLKVIVEFPVVDLGAQFPDKEIPCYCPFHSNFDHLLRKQHCDNIFHNSNCECVRKDDNKGIDKTCDNFKDHCMKSAIFYYKCIMFGCLFPSGLQLCD